MFSLKENRSGFVAQVLLLVLACVLSSREMFNENIFFPDADHLMLDGVFIADYVRDIVHNGFTAPMEYAMRYYGQYPALSIGYKPPGWPAIQAVFILIFGTEPWAVRLALTGFALLTAIALYRTVVRGGGVFLAFATAAFALSLPYLIQWSWYAMTELPALAFVLAAGWPFTRYLESRSGRSLALTILLLTVAVWCKQTAVVGALWLFFG